MIGNILLTVGLLTALFTTIMYFFTLRGYQNTLTTARIGFHLTAISVIAASALLLHAILTHQYQYKYIYNYSGSDLSLGLLISTFYAGQEGSFMLWTLFTVIVGLVLLDYTSKRGDLENRVMMIFSLVVAFLLVMVNPLLKSPFNYIWSTPDFLELTKLNAQFLSLPALQSFIFSDPNSGKQFFQMGQDSHAILVANGISVNDFILHGKGLNPLLQNFWMQIHPPILFVGFALSAVPFSFAFSALIKNEYQDWVKQSLPWVLTGSMVLGTAIMLGGYWAYGVLGWGGYWGWDPVENSSLVPWIIAVASIHTLLVQKKSQDIGEGSRFVKTNLILSILTFLLVLYSTFLTRSGILGDASVHSFVDPGMTIYLFLVILLGTFVLLGFGMIAYRWKYLNQQFNYQENLLSRELALFTGSIALIASAIIILVGTSAPIFGQTVELKFYNELNLPIAIIIGLLNGLSLLLKWKSTNGKELFQKSKLSLIITAVITLLIIFIGGVYDFMLALFTLSSIFAIVVNTEIAYRVVKTNRLKLGAYIAHIGIALFFVGVIATAGFTQEKQIDLIKGEKVSAFGHELTYTGYNLIEDGKKYAFNIDIEKGGSKSTIAPVMFIAEFNNSLMREPDILVGFTRDFYIAPVSYTEGENVNSDGTVFSVKKGESHSINGMTVTFNGFDFPKDAMNTMMGGGNFKIGAKITVEVNGTKTDYEPTMINSEGEVTYVPVDISEANSKIEIVRMDAGTASVELKVTDINSKENKPSEAPKEVLSVEASIKPFISLVWLGVILMALGFIISAVRRTKESQV